jgi:Ca2+-binding EF-hand superfamily protein
MEQLRKGFEITLKSKLAQKSTGNQSEETFLMRNFRHFDTDNDGYVSMNEWFKAIEKVGVVVPSMDDLKALFQYYDVNGDGQIDYKEFAHILYTKQRPEYTSNSI